MGKRKKNRNKGNNVVEETTEVTQKNEEVTEGTVEPKKDRTEVLTDSRHVEESFEEGLVDVGERHIEEIDATAPIVDLQDNSDENIIPDIDDSVEGIDEEDTETENDEETNEEQPEITKVLTTDDKIEKSDNGDGDNPEPKNTKNEGVSDKTFFIAVALFILCVGAVTFIVTFILRNNQMDKEISQAFSHTELDEFDEHQIVNYIIYYEDKEYHNTTELIGVITEPVTLKIRLYYANEDIVDKEAYVTFNPDKEDTVPKIKDGDYVQIILPYDTDVPTYKEFLEEVGVIEATTEETTEATSTDSKATSTDSQSTEKETSEEETTTEE